MNKQIIKNTVYLYLRMLISMGISLYTVRLVIATLGVVDYGIYGVVAGFVTIFAILRGSMSTATSRFLTFALGKGDTEELQKTFSAAVTIHFLIAFILLILAETAGLWFLEHKMEIEPERMNAARAVYHLSVVSVMATIIQVPYNATIIAHERMDIYAFIELANTFLRLGIVYLVIIGTWDKLVFYVALMLAVTCLIAVAYRFYCVKQFKECKYQFEWNKKVIYPMLTFSGWDTIGNGAVIAASQGVNVMLNLFFGVLVNAAYLVAANLNTYIVNFVRSFQVAVNPQIVKLYAVGKMTELYGLLFQSTKFSFSLMWIVLLPVFLNMEPILQIWIGEVPEYSAVFCRLVLMQSLISCMERPFVMGIHATGKMKVFQLSSGIVLLSVLPISYFFLKAGGASYIPFIVSIGVTAIDFWVVAYLLKRWINLSFVRLFKTVFIPILLIIACTVPVSVLAAYYLHWLLSIMISGLSVCISAYFIALTKEERTKVAQFIKNKFSKNK